MRSRFPRSSDDVLGAVHRHRHDGRAGPQGEADRTSLGALGPVLRVAGDAAFGEEAHRLPGGERLRRSIERLGRRGRPTVDRDEAQPTDQRAKEGVLEDPGRRQQPK